MGGHKRGGEMKLKICNKKEEKWLLSSWLNQKGKVKSTLAYCSVRHRYQFVTGAFYSPEKIVAGVQTSTFRAESLRMCGVFALYYLLSRVQFNWMLKQV